MSSPNGDKNCFAMILRSRIVKVIMMLGFSFMFTAVYVNFFQHPPPDMILAMNSRSGGGGDSSFGARSFGAKGPSNGEQDDGETSGHKNSGVKYADFWEKFLQRNNYVSIGVVYDKCENWHTQYGTVILIPDKEFGGVKARTFVNMTLDKVIDGGQFSIEVKYNGKDLYDNYWEICELDEELPPANRTFNCPVAAGKHSKVKDRHIPNYLPKGHYQSKAWATDEDENVFVCGFSDFTI